MTIAVIIPAFNAEQFLRETLQSITSGSRVPDKLIVVDDGSTDMSAEVARKFGASIVNMPRNVGPAACRNYAALLVQTNILVFLDADTCVHADTLELMEAHLTADTQLSAVIGAYDDTPQHSSLCSQYRNLAHCYVHRSAKRDACTFWSGCGAVRREAFLSVDGFDERYTRPSVEDIELGYRMTDRGLHILLDPAVQVTHTKRWTIFNSVTTDLRDRGIPWTVLLLNRAGVPNDLNLTLNSRLATACMGLAIFCALAGLCSVYCTIPAFFLAVFVLLFDARMLRFLYQERGIQILPVAATMRLLLNICNLLAITIGTILWTRQSVKKYFGVHTNRLSRIADLRKVTGIDSVTISDVLPLA